MREDVLVPQEDQHLACVNLLAQMNVYLVYQSAKARARLDIENTVVKQTVK